MRRAPLRMLCHTTPPPLPLPRRCAGWGTAAPPSGGAAPPAERHCNRMQVRKERRGRGGKIPPLVFSHNVPRRLSPFSEGYLAFGPFLPASAEIVPAALQFAVGWDEAEAHGGARGVCSSSRASFEN